MDSRIFIAEAQELITDIEKFEDSYLDREEEILQGKALQQRLDLAFQKLYNPTLPSASKLVALATRVGFNINQQVIDEVWSY